MHIIYDVPNEFYLKYCKEEAKHTYTFIEFINTINNLNGTKVVDKEILILVIYVLRIKYKV